MITRWLIAALLFGAPALRAGEALDRIVATVNGHALLESDWDDEVRYECLMSGRPLQDLGEEDRRSALNRLIDQELLREQMGSADFKQVGAGEVEKQLATLKADYARDHQSRSWLGALASYGLTEEIVKNRLESELNQLRLVDFRLRSSVQIDPAEIETYYKEQIVPRFAGGNVVTLQEVTPQIHEVLLQQKINRLLSSWLEQLRSQARIRLLIPAAQGAAK